MPEQLENIVVLSQGELQEFCGNNDEKIRALQTHLDAKLIVRGNKLKIIGERTNVERTTKVVLEILQVLRQSGRMTDQQFRTAMRFASERARAGMAPNGDGSIPGNGHHGKNGRSATALDTPPPTIEDSDNLSDLFKDTIPLPLKRRRLSPLTSSQRRYIAAIRQNTVTFGIGPAGTGKTYLAMAMAVEALTDGAVNRIILCRPAVEAGERLGFLPGDLAQKFDPYVRPLWDALYEMMDAEKIKHAIESGVIEIAPLAYMRGRTLNNAFVILDEGQNTTVEQMKMFLTRLGFESKALITGDITQVDLPRGQVSGLIHAQKVLKGIDGVDFVNFHNGDVVRHPLLTKIISAYEQEKIASREREESDRRVHEIVPPPRAVVPDA